MANTFTEATLVKHTNPVMPSYLVYGQSANGPFALLVSMEFDGRDAETQVLSDIDPEGDRWDYESPCFEFVYSQPCYKEALGLYDAHCEKEYGKKS